MLALSIDIQSELCKSEIRCEASSSPSTARQAPARAPSRAPIAAELGYRHVDSGAMYRAVGWKALRDGVPLDDEDGGGGAGRASPASR